jgi:hypothetical protein
MPVDSPVWLISGLEIEATREGLTVAPLFASAKTAPKELVPISELLEQRVLSDRATNSLYDEVYPCQTCR